MNSGALLQDPRFLLPLALFALFVALLAKWVSDVRAVRRWSRQVDEGTRKKLQDIQMRVAESEVGVLRSTQTEASQSVTSVGTLETMKDLLAVEEILGAGRNGTPPYRRFME